MVLYFKYVFFRFQQCKCFYEFDLIPHIFDVLLSSTRMSEKRRRSQLIYNSSRFSRDVNYDNVPHKHFAHAFACVKFAEVSNGTAKRNWFVLYTYSIEECYPTSSIVTQRSTTIHPFLGPPPLFSNVEEFFEQNLTHVREATRRQVSRSPVLLTRLITSPTATAVLSISSCLCRMLSYSTSFKVLNDRTLLGPNCVQ